ncbi:MAG TPA: rhodanese-like domain-containing protein [Crenotrichaceae bacterium]|nr:rhodanese-like domain-containing protein [Crenotrichaceae bacterium]
MIQRLNPKQAWERLQSHPQTILIDVRTAGEYAFVGHPPSAVFIPWKEAPDWTTNPDFIQQVEATVPEKDTPVILMCRSGQRSMQAAQALEAEGYTDLTNMEEGFEGDLDENKQRGNINGWRFHQLPWQQS